MIPLAGRLRHFGITIFQIALARKGLIGVISELAPPMV